MKKLLSILALVAVFAFSGLESKAQAAVLISSTDTLNNAETAYIGLPTLTGGYYSIGIQAVVTKVSGTVGGTAIIQGSLDGTNYVTIGSTTLTFSDQAVNTNVWEITPSVYQYHRVKFVSSGTQVSIPKVYYKLSKLLTN